MDSNLHRLLQRQIKNNLTEKDLQNENVCKFINKINEAFTNYDNDFKHIERIQEISSKESFKELNNLKIALDFTASVFIVNTKGIIQYANQNLCDILQYNKEDILNASFFAFYKPKIINDNLKNILKTIFKGEVWKGETVVKDKRNNDISIKTSIIPIKNNENKIIQFLFICFDITEEKKARELIVKNEEKYKRILKNMNLGLIEVDLKDKIRYVNKSFSQMSGYSFDELIGKKATTLFVNKTSKKLISEKEKDRKNSISDNYEIDAITKNGTPKTWLVGGAPNYDEFGNHIGSIGIHLDITSQRENEHHLLLLRSLLDHSGDSIQISDETGKFIYINEVGMKRLHLQKEEINNLNIKDFELKFQKEGEWEKHIEDLKKNKKGILIEGINVNKQNKIIPVEVKANYIQNNNKGYIVAFSRDITNRKEQEQKLLELLEKLQKANKELADFAYIVSHDLKAPLRTIGNLAGWLKSDYAENLDIDGQKIVDNIEQRTKRMHMLIEGVLNYSRIGQTKETLKVQNTLQIVNNIIDLLSPPKNIICKIDAALPNVIFEDIKFGQVFQNLISNALKFMDKENGTIEIGFEENKTETILFVKDNGPGIEEKYQTKIFQIFQTLNARDTFESTGIGLSIVKKIVEDNDGKIWLTSILGEGSTFYFSVPKHRKI